MDQMTINLLGGAAMAALGWFARTLWDGQKELQNEISNLHVLVVKDYVSYESLRGIMEPLKDDISYVRDKIDSMIADRRKEDKS